MSQILCAQEQPKTRCEAGLSRQAKRPVKVCFISPLGYSLYRPGQGRSFGGAEVQFFLLSSELSADPNFIVTVLTTVDTEPGTEMYESLTLLKRQGQQRVDLQSGMLLNAMAYGSAFKEMFALFKRIDADIYLHAGAGVEVGAYALICRLLRRRFTYIVVSSADLLKPYGNITGSLRWLYPLGLRLADSIVCQTQEQLEWLKDRYGRDGVLIKTGHRPSTEARGERSIIFWAGRAHPVKQPWMFLDLAERLRDENCVMALMKHPSYESLLEEILSRASKLPNVTIYLDIPWAEIGQLFLKAKIFVNTSLYEGFPNTFIEAALSATPVISLLVDPDGVLGKQQIGICAGGDFERLLELTKELLDDSRATTSLGLRARSYALANHSLDKVTGDFKRLIETLIGQSEGVSR